MLKWRACAMSLDGLSDQRAGGAGMAFVPGLDAGQVTGDEHVIVNDVGSEAAVDMKGRAFVFVEGEYRRKMRHDIPEADNAIADVDAAIEEADEIGVADAGLGPGVNGGSEIGGDVVEEI